MKRLYHKAKRLFDRYEKYLMPLTMAVGFVVDNLTLRRIDLGIENLVIIIYLLLATAAIFYINTYKKKLFSNKFLAWLNLAAPFALQYAFGALFSAFTVFYFRSATLPVSWPFLILLLSLLFGNEFFRQRYERLYFHLSILYVALFAYSVFALPLIVKQIGRLVFLGSGLLSLSLMAGLVYLLSKIDAAALKKNKSRLIASIIIIYCLFNLLYFNNIIPPIPLAMKTGGIYHQVARSGNDYRFSFEKARWYEFWRETSSVYHWQPGQRVYAFSAIFAPTKFNEQIFHLWLYYDEVQKEWVEKNKLNFSITGGSDTGYRGYSYKTTIEPGRWRVDVVTDTNQTLGRIKFQVIASAPLNLEEK